jgi:hypothetical protein
MTQHSPLRFLSVALLMAAALLQPQLSRAGGDERGDRNDSDRDRAAIADLIYCYARGTDAIGDATTNADPLAKGISIYKPCFAPNAEIRAWFPQQPFNAQAFPDPNAFPDTAPPAYYGATAWANFVNGVFRGNGYTFTQHLMSNIRVTIDGDRGTVTSYLNATHVRSGSTIGGVSRCVAVANGTYSGNVKKIDGQWKFTKLYLTLIDFNPVFQSGAGC